jgi:D-3-phosphoglycerate dehydrogenase
MNIIGYDVIPIDEEFSKEVGLMKTDLDTLLQSSDYVSLHVPLLDSTYHLINAKKLSTMKKTANIINTSRGGVIDEEALYDALKNGNLGGAALDVFEKEPATGSKLTTLPNVILTPHIGAQTKEAQSSCKCYSRKDNTDSKRRDIGFDSKKDTFSSITDSACTSFCLCRVWHNSC